MNSLALRIVAVLVGVAVVAVALALYINKFLREPEPVAAPATAPGRAEITLGTTPAVGSLGGRPTWVSYLARRGGGWDHTTTYSIQGVDPEVPVVATLLLAGPRILELPRLDRLHLDVAAREIRMPRVKTEASERSVPMLPALHEILLTQSADRR